MKTAVFVVASLSLVLSGCLGPRQIEAMSTPELAYEHGVQARLFGVPPNLRAEMDRRNMFTPEQWARIEKADIRPGDSELMMWAALGRPRSYVVTESVGTKSATASYDAAGWNPGATFHIRDGSITSKTTW